MKKDIYEKPCLKIKLIKIEDIILQSTAIVDETAPWDNGDTDVFGQL